MRPGFRLMSGLSLFPTVFAAAVTCAQENTLPIGEDTQAIQTAPPDRLACKEDQLTSFNGIVSKYSRTEKITAITISTDRGTEESVSIAQEEGEFKSYFLIFNRPFREEDWQLIEADAGKLRPGVRATAWICLDGTTPPVIDWQPGLAEPGGRHRDRSQP